MTVIPGNRTVRVLLGPGLAALIVLAVLLGLGTWQMQRLAWKTDLIARVQARAAAPPVPLAEALAAWRRAPAEAEFQRVRLSGQFLHKGEVYVYATLQGGYGWNVVTPFLAGTTLVAVMRGVVSDAMKAPETRAQGQIEGPVEIVGRVRLSERPSPFTPAPDPEHGIWYARDLDAMMPRQKSLMVETSPATSVAPFFVELESPAPPGGVPQPSVGPIVLRNDHLGYAATWYGLAAVLVIVFLAFARAQLRER